MGNSNGDRIEQEDILLVLPSSVSSKREAIVVSDYEPDVLSQQLFGVADGSVMATKTWSDWDQDPWYFRKSDGTKLGAYSSIVATLVKTSNRLYFTISFDKTSRGWRTKYESDDCPRLSVEIHNARGGTLWDNGFGSGEVEIRCGWDDHHVTYTFNLRDDIYSDAYSCHLYITSGTWRKC
jgi:hypothetical protein